MKISELRAQPPRELTRSSSTREYITSRMIDDTATELAARPSPDNSTMMTTNHVRSGHARSGTWVSTGG